MNVAARPAAVGKTRVCPHCKATILESLSICPGCLHHLRFDQEAAKRQAAAKTALRVEGIIPHKADEEPLEYFVIISIRNDRGEEVTRQVVGVGALQGIDRRSFSFSVEVMPPQVPPVMSVPRTPGATSLGGTPTAPSGTRATGALPPVAGTARPAVPPQPAAKATPAKTSAVKTTAATIPPPAATASGSAPPPASSPSPGSASRPSTAIPPAVSSQRPPVERQSDATPTKGAPAAGASAATAPASPPTTPETPTGPGRKPS
jgi:hypothetical protein